MMDFAHLEKMGRELKCPICLSLLKSSVTLSCNHVFCSSCIVESMRSVPNCPVCKIPFRRREVRPAPHMDNLVSIYKSMEAASGLNIFTSQVAPPKNSEESLQVADDKKANALNSVMMSQASSRGKRLAKGKRKKLGKADSGASNPCPSTRPSFSSNKRIHVTPYPVSETPIPQKKVNKLAVLTNEDTDIVELKNNNDLDYKRLGDPSLQPFFWLREANEEDNQTCMNLQKCCVSSLSKELPHSTMNGVLRKCKNIHSPIRCAFCHSSNDLELSGEIMHYYDGKSVAADFNGGVNVIHSHKNCTEWAPDVYFKDDSVINLSSELGRSRRIACSCCGIKGAALGCFEKSCRRSFHYPCAKQTPECRWDDLSFVNVQDQSIYIKSITCFLFSWK